MVYCLFLLSSLVYGSVYMWSVNLCIIFFQIQPSAESPDDYDLFIVVELGGLQYRKYLIQFPQSKCNTGSTCGLTYAARVVNFKRRNISEWKKTGRMLLPVLNDCYVLLFDQETNLLHSIKLRSFQFLIDFFKACFYFLSNYIIRSAEYECFFNISFTFLPFIWNISQSEIFSNTFEASKLLISKKQPIKRVKKSMVKKNTVKKKSVYQREASSILREVRLLHQCP